jgi:hypothetical protein
MSNLFTELNDMMTLYRKRIEDEGEDAIKELFKDFFQVHPGVEAITWTQYTPYFNDGEACTFGVNGMSVIFGQVAEPSEPSEEDDDEDEDQYEDDDDEEGLESWDLSRSPDPVLQALAVELKKLESIPDDVMESVFGDHVKIKATRAGFDVTDYEHD